MKNIFVIGLEPFNEALLKTLPEARDYRFHELLGYREAIRPAAATIDFDALVETAARRLDGFDGRVDAIIGYWDFPCSALVAVLRHRFGLPTPTLESVALCEHKYWSRLAQAEAAPEIVPPFQAVDPFGPDPLAALTLPFPFWIKPVKAHSSFLGFHVDDPAEFATVLPIIRRGIGHFGAPFDAFLARVNRPEAGGDVDGHHCIAEAIISEGRQCTLEGYVHQGETTVYGVVDSIREGRRGSCFGRYQYPSTLPADAQARMIAAAARIMARFGYDGAPFNMEFYWDPETDAIRVLEVNARLSKSHSPLFLLVDGVTHQRVGIDLALGCAPDMPRRAGRFAVAAKFMLRVFEDGVVRAAPTESDLAALTERFPEARARVLAHPGQRLAHLPYQDSYSYEIAEIFLGAESEDALLEKYREAQALLPFAFDASG